MHHPNILLTALEIAATILCFINPTTQGQQYFISGPTSSQFYRQNTNDYANQQIPPFRQASPGFQPIDSYFPQRDLQTSDLPFHLQQTLPQYRITTKEPPPLFQQQQQFQSPPTPFRPQSQNILPSTHRPNYSHLFSHAHNKNPSRTEQFLGEITLQSPAELPPTFNNNNNNNNNNNDFKPSTVPLFPSQSKIPSKTSGGFENVNQNLDYTEKPPVRDNSVHLTTGREGFLNHRTRIFAPDSSKEVNQLQVKDYFVNNNGDVFVTTKAPTTTSSPVKPSKRPTPKNTFDLESLLEEPIKKHNSQNDDVVEIIKSIEVTSTTEEPQETTDYDYDNTHNSTSSLEYIEYEDEEEPIEDEEPLEEEETDEHNDVPEDEEENKSEEIEKTQVPITESPDFSSNEEEESKQPELVVSVVTTKSVVNNTIVAPPVIVSAATQSTDVEDSTTDSWMVVASVQTSRSVSGGKSDERTKLLNEDSEEHTEFQPNTEHETEAENKDHTDENTEDRVAKDEDTEDQGKEEAATTVEDVPSTTLPPTKLKTSTESLIDKLDRVQSDLSSGLLTGEFKNDNIAVINENIQDKMHATTMFDMGLTSTTPKTTTTPKSDLPSVVIRKFSPKSRPTNRPRKVTSLPKITKQDDLTGLLPPGFKPKYQKTTTTPSPDVQGDEASKDNATDISSLLPPGYKAKDEKIDSSNLLAEILGKIKNSPKPAEEHKNASKSLDHVKEDDVSAFLPPDYKPSFTKPKNKTSKIETHEDDISAFLPPGYKSFKTSTTTEKSVEKFLAKAKPVEDLSSLLPPGYKSNSTKPVKSLLDNAEPIDNNAFLPPGYKENSTDVFGKAKPVDISSLLPPGYKANATKLKHAEAKPIDVGAFLPPGYKKNSTKPKGVQGLLDEARPVDVSAFLPPGYKPRATYKTTTTTTTATSASSDEPSSTTAPSSTTKKATGGFKVVFPSRPGGGTRKSATRLTTPKSSGGEEAKPTAPTIQKGWPSRATTEFTGWPTPSTTPISIEKLLEAARAAAATSTEASSDGTSSTASTTTTTTTTTTPKSTTPGICVKECDLAGTIKLIGGAKWVPELLDRNTKEWQILANEVQTQLENVFGESNVLNKWYKKLRIDGFSEGSVLVDYLVELNDLGRQIDTIEIKRLFHESLNEALTNSSNREAKALNETMKLEGKLGLGKFVLDPTYTDFIVLPKQVYPTVGYAEDNVLLPQWAIAVIVIGLASLLFVIIFGVTVLVNRQKNAKKKTPTPLTEDMLNELNKNHMGGLDNYGAEDLYNMEDVWNDRGFDPKIPRKLQRSAGSLHDNSMSNLYDSWRSEWNGYYYNAYYGNNPGNSHSHSGYGRRRSDYDTNF